jgi:exodeoxyribonuclease VII large subunit
MTNALTVTELTAALKGLVEPQFARVEVRGEVSGLRPNASGHAYFTLRDAEAQLPCVIWKTTLARMPTRISDGQQVVLTGALQLYGPQGRYQLVVNRLIDLGLGELLARLEALKLTLAAEGLFDPRRKRPLPLLPRRVGLVTALTGAAVHDFIVTAQARHPVPIVLCPSRVQGDQAPPTIVGALRALALVPDIDVIVVARGGGSAVDLLPYSDAQVVRAIAASPIPVVSAIGHEIDVTLADLAADRRAMTPTAAAELVIPRGADLARTLTLALETAQSVVERRLGEAGQRLDRALDTVALGTERHLRDAARRHSEAEASLRHAADRLERSAELRLALTLRRLASAHPERQLALMTQRVKVAEARLGAAHPRHRLALAELRLEDATKRMATSARAPIAARERRLAQALERLERLDPRHRVAASGARLDAMRHALLRAEREDLARRARSLERLSERLRLLSPLGGLDRGWALVRRDSGAVVRSVADLALHDLVTIRLRDGIVRARIEALPAPEEPR